MQNTVIEPGWMGYLTLELLYSPLISKDDESHVEKCYRSRYTPHLNGSHTISPIELKRGTPIAQVLFHRVDQLTEGYGLGKYQNQERGPQEAR